MFNSFKLPFQFLILLSLSVQLSVCSAQADTWPFGYYSERLSVEDGLSAEGSPCIMKDSQGFMWIGTTRGLNRFDGYEFRTFQHRENDARSLSDDYILCLYEDSHGMIWIGTMYGGLNRFDPASETFTCFPSEADDPFGIPSQAIPARPATT